MNIEKQNPQPGTGRSLYGHYHHHAFTPFGYIPLGFMNATIIHVPVIIGAIILGPKYGGFLGLVFGITSLWKIRTCRMPPRLCSPRLSKSESTAEISGAW